MQVGETWRSPKGLIKTVKEITFAPNWMNGIKILVMTDGTSYPRYSLDKWKEVKR